MPPKGYKLSAEAKENIRQGGLKYHIEAKIDRDELYSLYWDKELSAREIGELKGVTDSTVFNWLWRFKIPRRSPSEFTRLAYQKQPYPLFGEKSPYWKGGKTKHSGYIYVHIYPDNPFYAMAERGKGVGKWLAEHRLVMAQHLGRCLEKHEIVHHINGIKDDNPIENLELYPKQASHVPITLLKREINKQGKQLNQQAKQLRLLKWQVKTLIERLNEAGTVNPLEYED